MMMSWDDLWAEFEKDKARQKNRIERKILANARKKPVEKLCERSQIKGDRINNQLIIRRK